jgi:protein gp37
MECLVQNIPFFFKQWGKREFNVNPDDPTIDSNHVEHAKGGCQVNGKVYRDMPVM